MDELIRELKSEGVLASAYVADAFRAIDRADFVLPEYRGQAYENHPLPIGAGQTISQPYTVAFLLDLLDPKPGEKILDVGAGSGWQTTLLAHIVSRGDRGKGLGDRGRVYAVERIPELYAFAEKNIAKYGFIKDGTVVLSNADATRGIPDAAPFDKIVAAAAAGSAIPQAWRDQLNVGGCIVAPVADSIKRFTKKSAMVWDEETFPGFAFVPLVAGITNQQKTVNNRAVKESSQREATSNRQPPRNGKRRFLLFAYCFFVILAASGLFATFAPTHPAGGSRVEIQPGSGSRVIGELLKTRRIIRSKWVFVTYAAITGNALKLKPGTYDFGQWPTIPAVVSMLVQGEPFPNERFITIPEGWDLRDIGSYVAANNITAAASLWNVTGEPAKDYRKTNARDLPPDFSWEFDFLADKPNMVGLEGYLYPDTYRIYRDASARDIITKALKNFGTKLTPDIRAEIKSQGKTVFAVVTAASLVEKEVSSESDRKMVADILWRRIAAGIPLQIDASVNYITGKRETPTADDLAANSPFNTYKFPGLPLGPIGNPSIEAIRAVLFPEQNPYWYYLSTPDGKTIFSKTLEEHAQAKARYLH